MALTPPFPNPNPLPMALAGSANPALAPGPVGSPNPIEALAGEMSPQMGQSILTFLAGAGLKEFVKALKALRGGEQGTQNNPTDARAIAQSLPQPPASAMSPMMQAGSTPAILQQNPQLLQMLQQFTGGAGIQ